MRKLAALVFLAGVAVAVWAGAQWFVHRHDIKATVVFAKAPKLRAGDAVKENGRTIGKIVSVDPMDERHAVTIRLNRSDRRAIVTDSLFDVKDHALVVDNTFAIGRPIDDGAILEARDDRFARWLARHGAAAKPYIDAFRARIDALANRDFDEWTRRVPEWKKEGSEAFERHVEDVKKRVAAAEEELRKSDRAAEARKLKERFDKWLNEVGR